MINYYSRSLILNCLNKMLKLRQFKYLQNSKNSIFDTNWLWNILFIYLLHSCMPVIDIVKENKPVQLENLILGQIFVKKGFIWLVCSGNSFIKQLFWAFGLYRMITIFWEKIIPNNFIKRWGGAGANSPLHPHVRRKGGAPNPLHPSLDTGLGEIYIIILFLSNLHIMHSNVPALYSLIKIAIIVPNLRAYNFPTDFFLVLACFLFL